MRQLCGIQSDLKLDTCVAGTWLERTMLLLLLLLILSQCNTARLSQPDSRTKSRLWEYFSMTPMQMSAVRIGFNRKPQKKFESKLSQIPVVLSIW